MPKVLLVDDEEKLRVSLARRLNMRGYETIDLDNRENAVKIIRNDSEIDVVLLDRKMPGMTGEQVLVELKRYPPELQVIMLTGHGSMNSAMETGRLDAYSYLQKPYDFDKLTQIIDAAREGKIHAMVRHEIPPVHRDSLWNWLKGSHNSRPGVIILGLLLFATLVFMPAPERMLYLLSS